MAELAIIVVAALIAPALVALAIAIGRAVGVVPRGRRQTALPPLSPPPAPAPPETAEQLDEMIEERAATDPDDVRFCQACGHVTAGYARYCRACGALLDEI